MLIKNSFLSVLFFLFTLFAFAQKPIIADTFYIDNIQTNIPYLLNNNTWWQFMQQKELKEDYEQLYDTLENYEDQMKRIEEKFKKRTSEKEKDVPH